MKRIAIIVVPTLLLSIWCFAKPKADDKRVEVSPHAEAIHLVASTQQGEIRKIDKGDWWHDVKTREWKVKRPFHPGTIDSTHMFVVTYRIDGQIAQSWLVDTRNKTVEVEKAKTAEE